MLKENDSYEYKKDGCKNINGVFGKLFYKMMAFEDKGVLTWQVKTRPGSKIGIILYYFTITNGTLKNSIVKS